MKRHAFSLALAAIVALGGTLPARAATSAPHTETIVLAGGCFWGTSAVFKALKGVISSTSGYAGGTKATAQYEQVSTGTTGHAESVQVSFDPSKISYEKILEVFFRVAHDPTELNRQGPDDGTQYRSAIFYANPDQKQRAEAEIAKFTAAKTFSGPIVTTLEPLHGFYAAEAYHQDFMARHPDYPYIVINDAPKLAALQKTFPQLVRHT